MKFAQMDSTELALLIVCGAIIIKFLLWWFWASLKWLWSRAMQKADTVAEHDADIAGLKESRDDHERRITHLEDDERNQSGH